MATLPKITDCIVIFAVVNLFSACEKKGPGYCDEGCYTVNMDINGQQIAMTRPYLTTDYPYIICESGYIITPFDTDSLVLTYNTDIRLNNGDALFLTFGLKAAYTDIDTVPTDSVTLYQFGDTALQRSYLMLANNRFIPVPLGIGTPIGLQVTYQDTTDRSFTTGNYAANNSATDINNDSRFTFSINQITFQPVYQQQLNGFKDGFVIDFDITATLWDDAGNSIDVSGNLLLPFCTNF